MSESKFKFSASIYVILIFVVGFYFIYTLFQSSNNTALQLGSAFFIFLAYMIFWIVVMSSLVGMSKLRPSKVISIEDGLTGRILKKYKVGAGQLKCLIVADKGVIPQDKIDDYKKFFGFITKINFQASFWVTIYEKDLMGINPDSHTTPEGLYYYYGKGGLTGKGKIHIDKDREEKLKYYEFLVSIYSDSIEKINSFAQNLSNQNSKDLQSTAQILNTMTKQTTDATSGSIQNLLQLASVEKNNK